MSNYITHIKYSLLGTLDYDQRNVLRTVKTHSTDMDLLSISTGFISIRFDAKKLYFLITFNYNNVALDEKLEDKTRVEMSPTPLFDDGLCNLILYSGHSNIPVRITSTLRRR